MNMQAIMKQAQAMQKEITSAQKIVNETEFIGKNGLVTVKVMGTKEVKEIKIENDAEVKEDLSMLEDMIMLALNDAFHQIDKFQQEKLGKYSSLMNGMI